MVINWDFNKIHINRFIGKLINAFSLRVSCVWANANDTFVNNNNNIYVHEQLIRVPIVGQQTPKQKKGHPLTPLFIQWPVLCH